MIKKHHSYTPVPLLDVNAQNHSLSAELRAAFDQVLSGGQFILGEQVSSFEREFATYHDLPHAIGVSSGTDALLVALMALEIEPGDEVICPAFTFFATAGCVARLGAVPVFCDVEIETFCICADSLEKKITPKTRAIIPVHLFGRSANMEKICAIAKAHKLAILEDVAQAHGAKWQNRHVGTFGDLAAFSFFPSKNLGGFGDSGAILTNNPELAHRVQILRNHGMEPKYYHSHIGGNFRIDALQAALLRKKMPQLETYLAARVQNAVRYYEKLANINGVKISNTSNESDKTIKNENNKTINKQNDNSIKNENLPNAVAHTSPRIIILPQQPAAHERHTWNQFTLRVPSPDGSSIARDSLRQHLLDCQIGCEIYYPLALSDQQCFADLPEQSRENCPNARQLAQEVLSIPIYGEMAEHQQNQVIQAITDWIDTQSRG